MSNARSQGRDGTDGKSRVAFYTRISTDEDHQKFSLGAQADRLEAFCRAQWGDDWTLHRAYRDTESGTHMNRPGLEEMLFDAEAHAFDVLLVFRVDRLSRKVRELALMVDELTKHGVVLKSITEPFDTANAAGKMMLQMLGVFAEFEHATIVERTKVGMEKKARGGRFVGGYIPYGYALEADKGLVIREDEAVIVRKMFKLYAFGMQGASRICKDLNGAGLRNRNGRKWCRRVVLYMLRNTVYIGKLRWRGVIHEGLHAPLVSPELFEKAQRVLADRKEDLKGRQWHNVDQRLLTGVMRCARCKSHMFGAGGRKNGVQIPYYVCSKRLNQHDCDQDYVRAERIESIIVKDLQVILRDEEFLDRVWEEANRKLGAERPDLDREAQKVEAETTKVKATIEKYFDAFEQGTLDASLCTEKVRGLKARLDELEATRKDLAVRGEALQLPAIDREVVGALIDNFGRVMEQAPGAERKDLLHRLVKKVLVHDRHTVEVWYRLPNRQGFEHWNNWLPG